MMSSPHHSMQWARARWWLWGMVGVLLPVAGAGARQSVTVGSVAELQAYAAASDTDVTMTPGEYWLAGPPVHPSPAANYPIFLDLSGTNSTFDFTGVTLRVDTRELRGYGRAYGHDDTVRVLQISGERTSVEGLILGTKHLATNGTDGYGDVRQYTADWSTTLVEIIGSHTRLSNCSFTTGGSYPYGYGDAFGKGGRPTDGAGKTNAAFIDHRKQSGIRVGKGAGNVTLENVTLNMRSFGHGIFLQQGAHDVVIRNCTVSGDELGHSHDVIAHPVYQLWGAATYQQPIPADIRISKSEDGVRVYGYDATYGWVSNVTVEGTVVERMRDAYALGDMVGTVVITNCAAWECESGFTPANPAPSRGNVPPPASTAIADCRGDARHGPLLFFRRSGKNVTASVELAGAGAPQGDWPIALISGTGNQVTITRTAPAGLYPAAATVQASQHWREWRHRPATDIDASSSGNVAAPTIGCSIDNQSGQPLVLGVYATGNACTSDGGVVNKGSNNIYTGATLDPAPAEITDTWGTYRVPHRTATPPPAAL